MFRIYALMKRHDDTNDDQTQTAKSRCVQITKIPHRHIKRRHDVPWTTEKMELNKDAKNRQQALKKAYGIQNREKKRGEKEGEEMKQVNNREKKMECIEEGEKKERGEKKSLENLNEGEEKTYKRERTALIKHARKADPSGRHGAQSGRTMAHAGAGSLAIKKRTRRIIRQASAKPKMKQQ